MSFSVVEPVDLYEEGWNIQLLAQYLLEWMLDKIVAYLVPNQQNRRDKPIWGPSPDGCFYAKTTYIVLAS